MSLLGAFHCCFVTETDVLAFKDDREKQGDCDTHTHTYICTSLTYTDAEVFVEARTSMQCSIFQQQLDILGLQ